MAELTTLARPYAKAVFDAAQDQNAVDQWDQALAFAAQVAADQEVKKILANPGLTEQRKAELFVETLEGESLPEGLRNFLLILAENKRLALLPTIAMLFHELAAEDQRTIDVELIAPFELEDAETDKLVTALKTRLGRNVQVSTSVDESLIGGVLVRAGDTVIDGSVRGRLNRLAEQLNS